MIWSGIPKCEGLLQCDAEIDKPQHGEINRPWRVDFTAGRQSIGFAAWWWRRQPKAATDMWALIDRPKAGDKPPDGNTPCTAPYHIILPFGLLDLAVVAGLLDFWALGLLDFWTF